MLGVEVTRRDILRHPVTRPGHTPWAGPTAREAPAGSELAAERRTAASLRADAKAAGHTAREAPAPTVLTCRALEVTRPWIREKNDGC